MVDMIPITIDICSRDKISLLLYRIIIIITKILILIMFRLVVNTVLLVVIFLLSIITPSQSLSYSVFAQTPLYTITDQRIDGEISRANINFGNSFSAAVSLNEFLAGTTRADTGITIASLTFTQPQFTTTILVFLDCDGKIYITTEPTSYDNTPLPIFLVIDDPGTSGFVSGDTLRLELVINSNDRTDGITEPLCELATPANPIAVSSITDGNIFDTLDGAIGITTVKIGQSTYALVASNEDDGIQIINMTNPVMPTAVSSITDGVGGFDTLDGASSIITIQIGQSIYALVTASLDDGVQIIDITNPAVPTAVSSITDGTGVGAYDTLDGARSITTVQIGQSIYALVAAFVDNGVQIIDITNPAVPTAVSSITDGDTFDELNGAHGITTIQIDSSIYALVASSLDDGVQIIDITNPAMPTAVSSVIDYIDDGSISDADDIFDELDGARSITTIQIDSSIYALVAAGSDDGVQIIDISDPAMPTAVSSITDGGTFDELGEARSITTIQIDSSIYALVAAGSDDGVQIIDISDPAMPTAVSSITDGGTFDELEGSIGITTVQIDSSIYALVASSLDDGVQIIRIADSQSEPETPTPENPVCELTLSAISLDFGTLSPGDISNEGTIAIQNSGNVNSNAKIGADFWCDAVDNGCTGFNGVISPTQTSFGTTPNSPYASKQAFTDFLYDNTGASLVRGTLTLPFLTPDLFTLTPDETDTVYLQTLVELIPLDGGSPNRFTGAISQEMILESDCS